MPTLFKKFLLRWSIISNDGLHTIFQVARRFSIRITYSRYLILRALINPNPGNKSGSGQFRSHTIDMQKLRRELRRVRER